VPNSLVAISASSRGVPVVNGGTSVTATDINRSLSSPTYSRYSNSLRSFVQRGAVPPLPDTLIRPVVPP
jgi:hypothetical protein